MNSKILQNHEEVLEEIASEIDIPERPDELARERYKSISDWFERNASTIKQFSPEIYPQGSFLLGTVIRPLGDEDEFDIDLVCKLDAAKANFSMAHLKETVGVEVKGYAAAHSMKKSPENNRRCWTLEYADQANFHIDILPSLPNEERYRALLEKGGHMALASDQKMRAEAIAITDKTHPKYTVPCDEWPGSNPRGYATWFHGRQYEVAAARKRTFFEANARTYASIDEVPNYRVKTPLQQSIQLLKRHRDSTCGNDDDKPISIIITTLAALAYEGEDTIGGALQSILKGMAGYIEDRSGVKWVANPVYPIENFADKWQKNPEKEKQFFVWLNRVCRDFGNYAAGSYNEIPKELQKAFSSTTMGRVIPFVSTAAAPAIISPADAAAREAARIIDAGEGTKPWSR